MTNDGGSDVEGGRLADRPGQVPGADASESTSSALTPLPLVGGVPPVAWRFTIWDSPISTILARAYHEMRRYANRRTSAELDRSAMGLAGRQPVGEDIGDGHEMRRAAKIAGRADQR